MLMRRAMAWCLGWVALTSMGCGSATGTGVKAGLHINNGGEIGLEARSSALLGFTSGHHDLEEKGDLVSFFTAPSLGAGWSFTRQAPSLSLGLESITLGFLGRGKEESSHIATMGFTTQFFFAEEFEMSTLIHLGFFYAPRSRYSRSERENPGYECTGEGKHRSCPWFENSTFIDESYGLLGPFVELSLAVMPKEQGDGEDDKNSFSLDLFQGVQFRKLETSM